MRTGEVVSLTLLRQTSAEAASTGKVLADFGIDASLDGVAHTLSPAATITEATSTADGKFRRYKLTFTLPGTAGYFLIRHVAASGTDIVLPELHEGEIENNDLDTIHALFPARVSLSATGAPAESTPLTFNAYRYHAVSMTIVDANDAAIDLSATGRNYSNYRFAVWTRAHSGSIYSLSSGITGSSAGVVAFTVPENASFFTNIDAAIAASEDNVTLYWDLVADRGGVVGQTETLAYGTVTLRRFEAAA